MNDVPYVMDISAADVPPAIAKEFEYRTSEGSSYRRMLGIGEMNRVMVQEFSPEEHTFFAVYSSRRSITEAQPTVLTYAIDTVGEDEVAGEGDIRAIVDPLTGVFQEPIVDWTSTADPYLRQGLGRRRLLSMNAAARLVYGQALHSSDFKLANEAKRIWERLISEGYAEKFQSDILPRFRFTI